MWNSNAWFALWELVTKDHEPHEVTITPTEDPSNVEVNFRGSKVGHAYFWTVDGEWIDNGTFDV